MIHAAVGKPLPHFTANSTHGEIDSSQFEGRCAVLYFYPKDNTPGCTTEAQDFRDRHGEFDAANCQVIGISRDSIKSHINFTDKQTLPFPLIADENEELCTLFNVMKMKNMYGKQVRGVERSTFLVDTQGVLVREWRGLRVPGHADEVLQAVRGIA